MKNVLAVVMGCFLVATAVAQEPLAVQPSTIIQELIDAASPGDEVLVPAGEYQGAVVIKDRITLRGEGESLSIIDGQGANEVVTFGKEAAIIGFTLRNGQVLAANNGNYIGIFECTLENFARFGVFFNGGSGVVAHNRIVGGPSSVGIMAAAANPLVMNNIVEGNRIGFQWVDYMIPSLIGNLFRNNALAISGPAEGNIVLERNLFDGNAEVINTGVLPDGNDVRPVDAEEFVLVRGGSVAGYRDLMDATYEAAVKDHPIVIYDLPAEPGAFDVIILYPWASFTIGASTVDTVIESFEAYDWVADRPLHAEYFKQGDVRPSVRVHNPDIVEKMRERFVLENRYVHPGSYFDDEQGRRIFRRMTNIAQIEVVIPPGYQVVSASPEAIQVNAERAYLSMQDIGVTEVEVVMERIAAR
jgi:hypothetical protein